MKPRPILAALAALLLVSCAGRAARTEALLPALRQEWPPVSRDVDAYLGTEPADAAPVRAARDGFAAALEVDDRPTLGATWKHVQPAALAGIEVRLEAKQIGEVGAEIARDHVTEYRDRVRQLVGPALFQEPKR